VLTFKFYVFSMWQNKYPSHRTFSHLKRHGPFIFIFVKKKNIAPLPLRLLFNTAVRLGWSALLQPSIATAAEKTPGKINTHLHAEPPILTSHGPRSRAAWSGRHPTNSSNANPIPSRLLHVREKKRESAWRNYRMAFVIFFEQKFSDLNNLN
jgi:hypothetical protein